MGFESAYKDLEARRAAAQTVNLTLSNELTKDLNNLISQYDLFIITYLVMYRIHKNK